MKTYILGTAIKFESLLSALADSLTITIVNEAQAKKVDADTMTQDSDFVYSYIYQTSSTDEPGVYTAVIEATSGSGGYVSVSRVQFEMKERYT